MLIKHVKHQIPKKQGFDRRAPTPQGLPLHPICRRLSSARRRLEPADKGAAPAFGRYPATDPAEVILRKHKVTLLLIAMTSSQNSHCSDSCSRAVKGRSSQTRITHPFFVSRRNLFNSENDTIAPQSRSDEACSAVAGNLGPAAGVSDKNVCR